MRAQYLAGARKTAAGRRGLLTIDLPRKPGAYPHELSHGVRRSASVGPCPSGPAPMLLAASPRRTSTWARCRLWSCSAQARRVRCAAPHRDPRHASGPVPSVRLGARHEPRDHEPLHLRARALNTTPRATARARLARPAVMRPTPARGAHAWTGGHRPRSRRQGQPVQIILSSIIDRVPTGTSS